MGHNIDLIQMFGLNEKVKCPHCNNETNSWFDDYDIDCGDCNPSNGVWSLSCYCETCEHEWKYNFKVNTEEINDGC